MSVRWAIAAWVVLLAGVCGRVLVEPTTKHSVVPIYRVAAERFEHREPLFAPSPPLDVYRNPPNFALMFVPFVAMEERTSAIVWRLFSVSILLIGFWRIVHKQSATAWVILAVLSIVSLNNGQVNILMAGLIGLGFAFVMREQALAAAVVFALATSLKVYPAAAAGLAVLLLPRMFLPYLATTAALFALPYAFADATYVSQQWQDFTTCSLLDDRRFTTYDFRAPHDWTIVPRQWFGIIVPAGVACTVSAVVGLMMAWFVARRRRDGVTAFVLAGVWMTLFGPATEIPTYALLAPAAAVWWAMHRTRMSMVAVMLLAAPIVRGMFPSGVLMLREAAALGAMVLMVDVIRNSVPASSIIRRTARSLRPTRDESGQVTQVRIQTRGHFSDADERELESPRRNQSSLESHS